jgi:error-prone DNA polymerase
MVRKGYARDFAERCFSQIEGFGEYGFPESHAASFALLVYASAWIKCHYPDAFAAALLNSQPMGFYAPAQIVRDAREHRVDVRPVDINFSDYDATLEPGPPAAERLHDLHKTMRQDIHTTHALRLGLRAISGLREEEARHIVERRRNDPHPNPPSDAGRSDGERIREGVSTPYTSIRDVWLRTGLSVRTLERLADADAVGSLGLTRRQALWAVKALGRAGDQDDLPLLAFTSPLEAEEERGGSAREPHVVLPRMSLGEEVVNDYRFTHLSLKAHPASFLRDDLRRQRVLPNDTLRSRASGERVKVSGLITVRQRPGSAQGVIFMTIEDETGIANIIVWPHVFERFRPIVLGARYIAVSGPLQKESDVIHVVANNMHDLTPLLARLTQDLPPVEALARADAVKHPHAEDRPQPRIPGKIPLLSNQAAIALATDLDAPARGSAHSPNRRGR